MKLSDYFENIRGRGILATSDEKGKVNAALFARPHFLNEKRVAFIMTDRLTHKNLNANPRAVYLFMESGEGYRGKRLYLKKIGEEKDSGLIRELRRRKEHRGGGKMPSGSRFLVSFQIEKVLPLVGGGTRQK